MRSRNGLAPIAKALWYIESHFDGEITLESIEAASGVSRFHISRAFAAATGQPVMHYVHARRLTEAARALCDGSPDILGVALDSGYGSHEAFTRAFHERFGVTPETVRTQGHLEGVALVEALRLERAMQTILGKPRIEIGRRLLVAGLSERDYARIPFVWQRLGPYLNNVPGQIGRLAYGVCANSDDEGNFEYIAGVEVARFDGLPAELTRLRVPESEYAVFQHRDHVSTIRNTFEAIWSTWLPQSDVTIADAPYFERYDEAFDPRSGTGNVEIWMPIRR